MATSFSTAFLSHCGSYTTLVDSNRISSLYCFKLGPLRHISSMFFIILTVADQNRSAILSKKVINSRPVFQKHPY